MNLSKSYNFYFSWLIFQIHNAMQLSNIINTNKATFYNKKSFIKGDLLQLDIFLTFTLNLKEFVFITYYLYLILILKEGY